jgi:hypothetical protein
VSRLPAWQCRKRFDGGTASPPNARNVLCFTVLAQRGAATATS